MDTTLSFEFERYVIEHPEMLNQIPDGAAVVFLPKDDPELYRVNLETARKVQADGKATPVVFLEVEALAPVRSRLVNPPDRATVFAAGGGVNITAPRPKTNPPR